MSDPIQELDSLTRAVKRLRVAVLATLAVGAALVVAAGDVPPRGSAAKEQALWIVLALAAAAVFVRQAAGNPKRPPRSRLRALIASHLLSGAIGLVGVAAALVAGERTQGLGFLAAGALFAIGAPRMAGPGGRVRR